MPPQNDIETFSMTLQALCDLFPLSAPALALSLLPSLSITLQVPASRSYSRLPEPPSCHSSLAFSTCNCVFQKWHLSPSPFQVSRQPKYHLFQEASPDFPRFVLLHLLFLCVLPRERSMPVSVSFCVPSL